MINLVNLSEVRMISDNNRDFVNKRRLENFLEKFKIGFHDIVRTEINFSKDNEEWDFKS